MDSPSSSSSSSSDTIQSFEDSCQVCGRAGHGNHFGAITCRACAAFFRRFAISNNFQLCNKGNKCVPTKNGFSCKDCRLERCWKLGMKIDNFQFQRDPFHIKKAKEHAGKLLEKIPPSMDTFLGRSNLIIYCAPQPNNSLRRYIDVQFLINKASEVLSNGAETPLFAETSLEKLALGLQQIRGRPGKGRTTIITKIGKEETFAIWKTDLLKTAKWLTYFDDFQKLPHKLKMNMLKGIWIVWSRLDKLATVAFARREKTCKSNQMIYDFEENRGICDKETLKIDLSWCSRFTYEQTKLFDPPNADCMDLMIQSILDLQPTDVELAYMMCQLCFHHVGKRYQGEILKIADGFQEALSNDLHEYYQKRKNMAKYSHRLTNMMKINNHIQQGIYRRRVKVELMKVFDVFFVEYSDPDMFSDF